jgi:hypothetical protein
VSRRDRITELLRVELGVRLERGLLSRPLEAAEAERQAQDPGAEWSRYYAEWLERRYGGSA